MMKRTLVWAPQRAKLLACKSLCMPHLEYAAAAWDTSNKREITGLEQVQNQAVRFIAGLKGTRGISDAMKKSLACLHSNKGENNSGYNC